jgi:hypothetical protein
MAADEDGLIMMCFNCNMDDVVTIEEPRSNKPSNKPSNEPREELRKEPREAPSDWINRPPTDDEKEEYSRQSIGQVGELPITSAWQNDHFDDESDGDDDVPTLVLKRGDDNSSSSEEDSSEEDLPPLLVQLVRNRGDPPSI